MLRLIRRIPTLSKQSLFLGTSRYAGGANLETKQQASHFALWKRTRLRQDQQGRLSLSYSELPPLVLFSRRLASEDSESRSRRSKRISNIFPVRWLNSDEGNAPQVRSGRHCLGRAQICFTTLWIAFVVIGPVSQDSDRERVARVPITGGFEDFSHLGVLGSERAVSWIIVSVIESTPVSSSFPE